MKKNKFMEKIFEVLKGLGNNMKNVLTEKGLKPEVDKEYITMMDIEIYEGTKETGLIPEGSIVHKVEILTNEEDMPRGYNFIVKETGEQHHTNYPWILALNTPENLIKIATAKQLKIERAAAQKKHKEALSKVETLQIRK